MRVSVFLASSVLTLVPAVANAAPTQQACVQAYEETQTSMRRGRLLSARDTLVTCLDQACAPVLRSDCADWLKQIEARMPSVVVECIADGTPVRDVRLFVDGEARESGIDGRALDLDPGNHVFRIEAANSPPVAVEQVIREGKKLQLVRIELPSRQPKKALVPIAAVPERPASSGEPRRPVPWTVYATAGVGIAAAAGFTFFAISGASSKSDLEPCKPECSSSEISDVRTRFIAADVLLGVSVLAFGAATYLFFTRPTVSAPARSAAVVTF